MTKAPHIKYRSIAEKMRGLEHLSNNQIAERIGCHPGTVQNNRPGPRHGNGSEWTPERVAELKKDWAAGYSASQIATRLGGVSRCAVTGKVWRLGLSNRGPRPADAMAKHKPKTRRAKARDNIFAPPAPKVRPAALICDGLPLPTPAEFDVARVSFNDLERHHCRFPCLETVAGVPQDQPMFCGLKPIPGLPYCAQHSRRAFDPVQLRRREIRVPQERVVQVA